MNLPVPTVSVDPGPDWANNINSCLSILDQHNHASGSGVQITQAGINLTSLAASVDSLNFNTTNAYGLRSLRFAAQSAALALATDVGCVYESGVDLYYNDGSGNQIRLTQGGSIVGTAGSITGLPSGTASAAYSGSTFVFQSATSTSANVDAGSYIVRQNTASANGITLSSPNSLAANYTLTLPTALASGLSLLTSDGSGNLGYISSSGTLSLGTLNVGTLVATTSTTGTLVATGSITVGSSGPVLTSTADHRLASSAGLFFPGGITLAALEVGAGTKTLGVRTSDGAGGASAPYFPLVVSATPATNGLLIVRGIVDATGNSPGSGTSSGEGWTCSYNGGTFTYTITFTSAFLDLPSVTATSISTSSINATIVTIATTFFQIRNFTVVPSATANAFTFVAIGQRGV